MTSIRVEGEAELPVGAPAIREDALVHVAGFFRGPEVLAALQTRVLPRLCTARSPDSPLRFWVPGCSTGEEVYSIAITLLEFLSARPHPGLSFKIFGTDLDLATIDRARAGQYPANIERDVSAERLQRFFSRVGGSYRIRRDVRELCTFGQHDVTRDPPFSSMDLVSCRTLMSQLAPAQHERVIARLHGALEDPGFLVLGTSATVGASAGFAPFEGMSDILTRSSTVLGGPADLATPSPRPERGHLATLATDRQGARSASASKEGDVHREADRLVLAELAPPGVVVTEDLAIVEFRGQTGVFLAPAPGVASLDLLRMTREDLRLPLRQALDEARSTRRSARRLAVAPGPEASSRSVVLRVLPFSIPPDPQSFFLVAFEDVTEPEASSAQLEATNEGLEATNEEVASRDQELRSSHEELQRAKRELQATHEELRTLDEEMRARDAEAARLSDDLTNVLGSLQIPILILGRDGRLRRFTAAAEKVFGVSSEDVDRPLTSATAVIAMVPTLPQLLQGVFGHLAVAECRAQGADGRWYQVSVCPYVTSAQCIDGAVVAAVDVDASLRSMTGLAEAQAYAEQIVEAVRDPLVVLEQDLTVRSVNDGFLRTFALGTDEATGRRLSRLGREALADPALVLRLAELREGDVIDGLRVSAGPEEGGGSGRTYVASARHIAKTSRILLALEDVTEAEVAARALEQAETGLRDMLLHAASAILLVDRDGRMVFVNGAAAAMFGYAAEELPGQPIELLLPERHRAEHAVLRESYAKAPSVRGLGVERELKGRRKDGSEFPVDVSLAPTSRSEGARVVAFVRDLTEQRDAERRIHESQDKLQQMDFDRALTEERERRRIALELHDRIGQSLALAQIKLTSARDVVTGAAQASLDEVIALLDQSAAETRTLTFELSPPILYDLGLKEALSWLAEDIEHRYGIRVDLRDDEQQMPLDDTSRALVFRAVRELLMNVFKHAKTPSAKVEVHRVDDRFDIVVEDSGVGFDVDGAARQGGGFGLLSVREQIRRLGGRLEIVSKPSLGTKVTLQMPIAEAPVSTREMP